MASRLEDFRSTVEQHTAGNSRKALPLGDYLTMMEIHYPARRASARAQITRDLKVGGSLRDLVEKGLVLADVANRQPECFAGVERKGSTLPVVIDKGPVADLRLFPGNSLTPEAREVQTVVATLVSTRNLPVKVADDIATQTGKLLFEVEREKLRADAAEERARIHQEHLQEMRDINRILASQLPRNQPLREAAE